MKKRLFVLIIGVMLLTGCGEGESVESKDDSFVESVIVEDILVEDILVEDIIVEEIIVEEITIR